jgi:hypothetical protein
MPGPALRRARGMSRALPEERTTRAGRTSASEFGSPAHQFAKRG